MPFQAVATESIANGLIVFFFEAISQMLDWSFIHGKSFDKVLIVDAHSARKIDISGDHNGVLLVSDSDECDRRRHDPSIRVPTA